MAKISEKINRIVNDYISEVNEIVPISKVFLYGSYANGNNDEYSDLDIAIFSEGFRNKKFVDVTSLLFSIARKYKDICIEPVGFSTSDLYENNPFIKEILSTGIEINIQ